MNRRVKISGPEAIEACRVTVGFLLGNAIERVRLANGRLPVSSLRSLPVTMLGIRRLAVQWPPKRSRTGAKPVLEAVPRRNRLAGRDVSSEGAAFTSD